MRTQIILFLSVLAFVSCTNVIEEEVEVNKIEQEKEVQSEQFNDGQFVQKFPNGSIQIKGELFNNEREGLWMAYYENGTKQSESTYKRGVLDGRTASFYPSGQIRYIGYFLRGKKDGKWDFYSEEGELDKSDYFEEGVLSK